ncbi:hypothetical protein J7J24_00675 [bacterium]|nr:hypothetical protein [bacterium]
MGVKRIVSEERNRQIKALWEECSVGEIGAHLGLSKSSIYKRARNLNLPHHRQMFPKVRISQEMKEVVDGLLLGGAALMPEGKQAYFVARSQQKIYLEWVLKMLREVGISPDKKGVERWRRFWQAKTKFHYELMLFYKRWYPHGRKDVPLDLKLTPRVALLWFIRGGHLEINDGKPQRALRFWIGRYSVNGRNQILKELQAIGLKPAFYVSDRIAMIRIGPGDLDTFFNYIGPCPPELQEIFGHKWMLPQ